MPTWFEGMPFGIAVVALFLIVLLRAQATYWIGRGVVAGALRTRFADKLTGPRTTRAIELLNRWGPPVVTVSFLTVGFQTVANARGGPDPDALAALHDRHGDRLRHVGVHLRHDRLRRVRRGMALATHSPWPLVAVLAAGGRRGRRGRPGRRRRRSAAAPRTRCPRTHRRAEPTVGVHAGVVSAGPDRYTLAVTPGGFA